MSRQSSGKMNIRRYISIILGICMVLYAYAGKWTTHFAYNNVTQIAMTTDRVFALSDGSIYSVDKQSEQIRVYNNQSGLHGTGITCIHYDATGKQLIIGYGTGKIDILSSGGVQYISELYNKDMTQRKTIYNVTISGRMAYLATAYGIQTMDLRERKLVDSYWLRPGGQEIEVKDVLIQNDSIYAFTDDSLFCAALSSNLVDFRVWKREKTGRVSPDNEKGKHYQDATNHWYAGYSEGIIRFTQTERLTYKPQGPLVNKPYYILAEGNQVFMLAGGHWTAQDGTPGHVMRYKEGAWHNTSRDSVSRQAGIDIVRDFMNVAIDPKDPNHYFTTSYGTGLYEFRNDKCVGHTTANGVITSAVPNNPQAYTRLSGGQFDSAGRLWFLNADNATPVIIKDGNSFYGLPLTVNDQDIAISILGDLLIDNRQERYKWISGAYKPSRLILLDDGNTPMDATDDRACLRREWVNQHSRSFSPVDIFAIMQDRQGRLWLATEQGAAYIDENTDFFTSDAIVQPDIMDNNGENPITTLRIKALCQSTDGHIWIGTETLGVYELNEEATEILGHYTTDNSAMSANGILSLAADTEGHIWIGTADGLVEYNPEGQDEGIKAVENEAMSEAEEGSMQRWRLHLSYSNPTELAATNQSIFAVANGSLFSVDRADGQIVYWNKATGLNGTGVAHIAYDHHSSRLIIAYENGHIDLLDEDGEVIQMPDISMKAGSIALTINDICVGKKQTYLAMPFGIIAIQPRKGEVSDTYYIGSDAANVDVEHLVELGDTLYAFSYDRIYKASTKDNLVDYTFWKTEALPFDQAQEAVVYHDQIYVLAHNTLYRRTHSGWEKVRDEEIQWMNAHDGQLLVYTDNGLFRLTDDGTLSGLNNLYRMNSALYSNGEYWIAETNYGLIRLGTQGDEYFHTEGPNSNFGYCMYPSHGKIYSAIGGRWATQFLRYGRINIYDGSSWRGIDEGQIGGKVGKPAIDIVSLAVDPNDEGHFFAATYGTGVYEFKNYEAVARYDSTNSTLRSVAYGYKNDYFTRTDGAMMDKEGNFWVLNATATGSPLHVRTPNGQWKAISLYSGGAQIQMTTPGGRILPDRRNSRYKWLYDQRLDTRGVILYDDGGTPTSTHDDHCVKRNSWVDQNGNVLSPANIMCLEQDMYNRLWIGTEKGIILIPKEVDFFSSNACRRIIIPRNDGTGLGDYLLGDEQINCIAVDGGNRVWIGTANSGLYLIEDDTITVAHFTENNSLLPANNVQSIAIMPNTGEVFVGTDRGIASYRSDASEAQEDMSGAYAFPNPVRPNYSGMISIAGLMENTVVNIVDEGGNLVCKTKSHGGTAVWDGKLPDGRRATPGVYTALCNANGGHTVVKILVIR